MFVVLCYDVGSKRVAKTLKTARKYLNHVQRSVFEGYMTDAKLKRICAELEKCIDPQHDTVNIYTFDYGIGIRKKSIGVVKNDFSNFL